MPLFARRRIQAMLDELGPSMERGKARDIVARLSRKRQPEQVIAAEMELGLLWAVKQVAHLEVEPRVPGSRRPDSYSRDLFGDLPAVIEITTVSDAHFSGEKLMRRAFTKISEFANKICKGASSELSLQFGERSYWDAGQFHRVRRITADFELNDAMREQLRAWLLGPKSQPLRLEDFDIAVAITWQAGRKIRTAEYWSTMPPLAYDIETNPVFGALTDTRKKRQLRYTPSGALRCVFIADGGCELLRNIDRHDHLGTTHSGRTIIEHAMERANIDVVCAFAPERLADVFRTLRGRQMTWAATVIAKPQLASHLNISRIQALAASLPRPRFEGYQARSLQDQGGFAPNSRGWYLGTTITWHPNQGREQIMLKMSARALHEFLAGRITREQFERGRRDDEPNPFEHFLKQGYTLSASRLEPAGIDEDDDEIVFEFAKDAAASDFYAALPEKQR